MKRCIKCRKQFDPLGDPSRTLCDECFEIVGILLVNVVDEIAERMEDVICQSCGKKNVIVSGAPNQTCAKCHAPLT